MKESKTVENILVYIFSNVKNKSFYYNKIMKILPELLQQNTITDEVLSFFEVADLETEKGALLNLEMRIIDEEAPIYSEQPNDHMTVDEIWDGHNFINEMVVLLNQKKKLKKEGIKKS